MAGDARLTGGAVEIFVVGSSQAVASAEVRERLYVDLEEVYSDLGELLRKRGIVEEAVALATCGRLELYCVAADPDRAAALLARLVSRRTGLAVDELRSHTYALRGATAVRHLFRVASGLDSVVHGEAQILGQVREAAHHPLCEPSKGPILHRLFEHALQTGKRVRTETEVGRGAASLASAAVQIVRQEMKGDLRSRSAVVLGAGDTGRLVAVLLRKAGMGRLTVANRTLAAAEDVAREVGGEASDLSALPGLLADVDLVVGAVTLGEYVVTADMVRALGPRERHFLDLAHPRNVDPEVAELPDARLLDLDQVFERVEAAREARAAQMPQAEAIVKEHAQVFMRWFRARPGISVLRAVRQRVLRQAEEEAERLARGRSERERDEMRRLARSLARTLLHPPTVALREADPSDAAGRALLESATELFGVEPDPR